MTDFAGWSDEELVAEVALREAALDNAVKGQTDSPSPENAERSAAAQKAMVEIRSYLRRCGEAAGTRGFVKVEG